MDATSEAAGAARINIVSGASEQPGLVAQVAEGKVAAVAQQPAVDPSRMAMVDVQPTPAIISTAKVTSGRLDYCRRLIFGQSVAANDRGQMLLVGPCSVTSAISFLPFRSVLRAIFSHPLILALAASRLANSSRDIVEAIVADWVRFPATTARFFHSVFRSRIARLRRVEALS